jgi:hypothetical protein
MTLLDIDTDTIQHLDFELEIPDPCVMPECNAPADFDVTHRNSCGFHIKWCGTHAKIASINFSLSLLLHCASCGRHFLASDVVFTPIK